MSRPSTPSRQAASTANAGSTRSHRQDVLQFLDDLDALGGNNNTTDNKSKSSNSETPSKVGKVTTSSSSSSNGNAAAGAAGPANSEDPQAVLDFLDEMVASRERRSATPTSTSGAGTGAGKKSSTGPVSSSTANAASSISRTGSRAALRGAVAAGEDKDASTSNNNNNTRKSGESARSINMTAVSHASPAGQAADKLQEAPLPESVPSANAAPPPSTGAGWGWGSVWSQASTVLQQARTVAEEQARNLPKNLPTSIQSIQNQLPVSPSNASSQAAAGVTAASAQAQKWRSGMMNLLSAQIDIDKLRKDITETGFKAMQDIMNAVAPPIAEHEVIQIWLSHDMVGYEGVETLVYRALAKVMEQVEGGDLVVNKGNAEDAPSGQKQPLNSEKTEMTGEVDDDDRNLNTIEGFLEGYKLAEANLEAMIKRLYVKPDQQKSSSDPAESSHSTASSHTRKGSNLTVPVTYCPVYMRIQPVLATMPFSNPAGGSAAVAAAADPSSSSSTTTNNAPQSAEDEKYLFFVLILRDPTNELVHKTLTQSMPSKWLDIPFEENEWVEDIMVEVIRRGVEIIGEEYVKGRMHGRLFKNAKAETLFEEHEEETKAAGHNNEKDSTAEKLSEAQVGI